MSNTYLAWAKDNFELNGLDLTRHKLVQQDCLEWLKDASAGSAQNGQAKFDLIFLDPPSFSNSKRMQGVLDIQRDHVGLIDSAMSLLTGTGQLVFSNNLRKFKLDEDLSTRYQIKNVTQRSIDKDFERHAGIHQCWLIEPI